MYTLGQLKLSSISKFGRDDKITLISLLAQNGSVLIDQIDIDDTTSCQEKLARIGSEFGAPILHRLSDLHGVHPIRSIPSYPEYANTTNADLNMHTDGAFEDLPPKIMLIYCEQPSEVGGLTRVCNGLDIYRYVESFGQNVLDGLFLPNAFFIKRDDKKKMSPVFRKVGDRIQMAYRYGSDILVDLHPKARQGFEAIEDFLATPENYIEFKLEKNQIFIFDNTRVLHGRTAFPEVSKRSLYGLWCDGQSLASSQFPFGLEI